MRRSLISSCPRSDAPIEQVSNIADRGYLGVHRTIYLMIPLLQAPSLNPHATLITLFMNVVEEYSAPLCGQLANLSRDKSVIPRVMKHLSLKGMLTGPDLIKFIYAIGCVTTYDHILDL